MIYLKRKELSLKLTNLQGRFAGVTWVKKNGETRTINCRPVKGEFFNMLGYIKVKTSKGKFKLVDPRTILKITANGETYKHKSLRGNIKAEIKH